MLRTALALLSTLQLGARVRDSVERSLRQAAVVAAGVIFLLVAAVFALFATYHVLVATYQFSPAEAAAIMAGSLLLVGVLLLAIAPQVGKPRRRTPRPQTLTASDGMGMIDQTVGKAVEQVGPVPLLITAFIAGVLAGRR